jgi:hypothetical protein
MMRVVLLLLALLGGHMLTSNMVPPVWEVVADTTLSSEVGASSPLGLFFFSTRTCRLILVHSPHVEIAQNIGTLVSVLCVILSWSLHVICLPYRWFGPSHVVAFASACTGGSPVMDFAYMLAGDEDVDDWDARKYPMCRPYSGVKGTPWLRFVDDLSNAMQGICPTHQVEGMDLAQTMFGTDIGGDIYMQTPIDAAGNLW